MLVRAIVLGNASTERTFVDYKDYPLAVARAAFGDEFSYISFIGVDPQQFVRLTLFEPEVSQSSARPFDETMWDFVAHFNLCDAREGLRAQAEGENVVIYDQYQGIYLWWEVYGLSAYPMLARSGGTAKKKPRNKRGSRLRDYPAEPSSFVSIC